MNFPLRSLYFDSKLIEAFSLLASLFFLPIIHFEAKAEELNPKPFYTLVALETSPRWSELNDAQKKALMPLQNLWPSLEANRKRKWLAIAQNFADMNESSQILAQERMREWAALTPLQRSQARLSFAQIQQLSSDEKLAKWEAYQSLNDEEKQKIPSSKPLSLKGGALAVKPISPEKLTLTPVKKEGQTFSPRIDTSQLNPFTLLPAYLLTKTRPSSVE
jgi:hypothetical protein